ncbi:MAG: tetratricopeptide repeat protein [Chitinophagales bacterium]
MRYLLTCLCLVSFGLLSAQTEPENISLLIQNGKYEQAQTQLDNLLENKKHAKDPYYHYLYGRLHKGIFESNGKADIGKRLEAIQKAFDYYLKAYELSAQKGSGNKVYLNSANQILKRIISFARELLSEDKNKDALQLIRNLYENIIGHLAFKASTIADVGLNYAIILEQEQDNQAAIEIYRSLLNKAYFLPEIFLNLSYLYQSENNYEKALEVLMDGRKHFPQNKTINIDIVNYALLSDQSDEIIKELKTDLKKDSSNIQLALAIATLYDKQEMYETAKEYYRFVLKLDPDFLEIRYNLGVLLYNQFVDLNKFLMKGDTELSFQDLNAQRNRLIEQCRSEFEYLKEKGFNLEEVNSILEQLEQL